MKKLFFILLVLISVKALGQGTDPTIYEGNTIIHLLDIPKKANRDSVNQSLAGKWDLSGNASGTSTTFLGFTTGDSLRFKVKGDPAGFISEIAYNTVLGPFEFTDSLGNYMTGQWNTMIGNNKDGHGQKNITHLSNSIFIGEHAKPAVDSLTNDVVIGVDLDGTVSNQAILGNANITSTILRGAVQIPKIVPSVASSTAIASLTVNTDVNNGYVITAQNGPLTINNPTGTPSDMQIMCIRIKDNGTARAITYGTEFRASSSLALPTTTTISKTMYMEFKYNAADVKWDLVRYIDNF